VGRLTKKKKECGHREKALAENVKGKGDEAFFFTAQEKKANHPKGTPRRIRVFDCSEGKRAPPRSRLRLENKTKAMPSGISKKAAAAPAGRDAWEALQKKEQDKNREKKATKNFAPQGGGTKERPVRSTELKLC